MNCRHWFQIYIDSLVRFHNRYGIKFTTLEDMVYFKYASSGISNVAIRQHNAPTVYFFLLFIISIYIKIQARHQKAISFI
jgi:hypothetical protein